MYSSNMKIGILTFQRTNNYGALLQCYALYYIIKRLGYEVEVIDYECHQVEVQECLRWDGTFKSLVLVVLYHRKAKLFSHFLERMALSPRCSRSDFIEVVKRYDRIVVGSDQVWNPECTGYDKTFFLDQVDDRTKKLSYAASIGLERLPDCQFDYASLLNGFSSLLVREETAAREIRRYVKSPVNTVLDPTLLADSTVWKSMLHTPARIEGKRYVLVYAVSEFDRSLLAARKMAVEHNLEIVQIQQCGYRYTKGAINLRSISPEDFVGLISGAQATVVSSFHGVCLSIINGVDFYYATDTGASSRASRVFDLLKLLGIEGRSVEDYLEGAAVPLNWNLINERLLAERRRSLELLATSLRGAN